MDVSQQVDAERQLALTAHERRKAFHARIARAAALLQAPPDIIRRPPSELGVPAPVHTPINPEKFLTRMEAEAKPNPVEAFYHLANSIFEGRKTMLQTIQKLVCGRFNITRAELLSPRRERRIVVARHVGFYLCRLHSSHSLPEIGRRFGGRDHTTVLYGMRQV